MIHFAGQNAILLLQLTDNPQLTLKIPVVNWKLTPGVRGLDLTNTESSDRRRFSETVVIEGSVRREDAKVCLADLPEYATDAHRLALAVLSGDTDGALALSDEVQLQHAQGEWFVSRKKLLTVISLWAEWVRLLRESGRLGSQRVASLTKIEQESYSILRKCEKEVPFEQAPLPDRT